MIYKTLKFQIRWRYHRLQNILYPQRWQIFRRKLAYQKLKTFPLLYAVKQSEASRNYFRKICHLWDKDIILLPLVPSSFFDLDFIKIIIDLQNKYFQANCPPFEFKDVMQERKLISILIVNESLLKVLMGIISWPRSLCRICFTCEGTAIYAVKT